MPRSASAVPQSENHLLALLPQADYARLSSHLHLVKLEARQPVWKTRGRINDVYFPLRGIISAMTVMEDGDAIEVATVGNEGMAGLSVFVGGDSSANEVMVQVAGEAMRMRADFFRDECKHDSALRRLLVLYHNAYLTQISYSVACNGLHKVEQRCCRWLLMTRDRVGCSELQLTHEFLAIMLGVRRSSLTEVLGPLQALGLIRSSRGKITILDRPGLEAKSCECYRAINNEFNRLFGQSK